ncbi:S-layer homology domain-containing protein [Bifidobacterium ramosum]|nr:S-layer homology domain-containing protein [Bifidobacterium ramosum]
MIFAVAACVAAACMSLSGAVPTAVAEGVGDVPASSDNMWRNDYEGNWAAPVSSYLHQRDDGSLERVEWITGWSGSREVRSLRVERYDASFRYLSGKNIDTSLIRPTGLRTDDGLLWGGFFAGSSANYVVTGQANRAENDALPVVRITKFTKDWRYAGKCELSGINTYIPFDGGSLRMTELDGQLWIRTAHTIYKLADGLHHQTNMSFVIDEATMTVVDKAVKVADSRFGYVSHSFNQFILTTGGKVYAVDHGDAYPRAIVLTQVDGGSRQVHPIAGEIGDNYTGVAVGGFESADAGSRFLIAMAVDSVGGLGSDTRKSPVLLTVNGADPATATVAETVVQSYAKGGATDATNPQLVKIGENRFLMMWGERREHKESIRYVFLDGHGNRLGAIRSADGRLSDCQPIVVGGKVVWYVTDDSAPTMYAIDGGSGAFSSVRTYTPFSDVNAGTPHAADITWLSLRGITTGWIDADGRSTFRGMNAVTRQDMAAFLYRLTGSPKFDESKARNPFVDVTKSTPHYKEILWLASTGVSTGWKTARGAEFRGMNAVVRQDMAAFLHRLADYQQAKPTLGKAVSFRDVSKSTPHVDDIVWLSRTGVATGWSDGTFRGMNAVVRQDMAAFLHRMNANVLK